MKKQPEGGSNMIRIAGTGKQITVGAGLETFG
jgi:hypothetical protein